MQDATILSPSSFPQVIVEAVPDSFDPSQMPDAGKDEEKGFLEIFFGTNPNKGKVSGCRTRAISQPPLFLPCLAPPPHACCCSVSFPVLVFFFFFFYTVSSLLLVPRGGATCCCC